MHRSTRPRTASLLRTRWLQRPRGVCVWGGGVGGMLTPIVSAKTHLKHPPHTHTNSPCGRHQRSLSAPGPELPVPETHSVRSSPGRGGWTPGELCSGTGPGPQGASQGLAPLRPGFHAVKSVWGPSGPTEGRQRELRGASRWEAGPPLPSGHPSAQRSQARTPRRPLCSPIAEAKAFKPATFPGTPQRLVCVHRCAGTRASFWARSPLVRETVLECLVLFS